MSDDLKLDYYFVYKVIDLVVEHLKTMINSNIKKIIYVSVGNQYKSVYPFQTICHHESDFGVSCDWIFFAISHVKCPCDGLGGTTKRLTTRASLQWIIDNQITFAKEMFQFCTLEIQGIEFVFIEKEDSCKTRNYFFLFDLIWQTSTISQEPSLTWPSLYSSVDYRNGSQESFYWYHIWIFLRLQNWAVQRREWNWKLPSTGSQTGCS